MRKKNPMIAPAQMKTKLLGRGDVCMYGAICVGGTDGEGIGMLVLIAGKEIEGFADDPEVVPAAEELSVDDGPAVVVVESESAGKDCEGCWAETVVKRKAAANNACRNRGSILEIDQGFRCRATEVYA